MIECDHIYNKDCLEVIDELLNGGGCVDCVLTDPPYNINFSTQHRKENFDVIVNDNLSEAEFLTLLQNYFSGCYKLLKNDGFLITFMSWRTISQFEKALKAAGFAIKSMPIWVKNNFGIGYYTRPQYEPMYLCLKGNPKPPREAISDVIHCPRVKDLVHSCQKPVPLIMKLLQTFTNEGDIIFDGFIGSGTTAIAAAKTQRHYIGCEIDTATYKTATERVERETAQMSFFDSPAAPTYSQRSIFDDK